MRSRSALDSLLFSARVWLTLSASNFSNNIPVDTVETEKSRIILRQLEHGWWLLASIDLTQLPAIASQKSSPEKSIEYSSREVAPATLLITQIAQAHAIFLLHHAGSLNDLHSRVGRPTFCGMLNKYWTKFARSWDVLLHGNPAVNVLNATKLAGGGEIGVGVGEEEWGSGEREVLEDFVHRTEGLLELVVARYGNAPGEVPKGAGTEAEGAEMKNLKAWIGIGDDPRPSDGVVFSGVGALSRRSLATVSQWVEEIFRYGDGAYGIGENPSSRQRPRRRGRRPENPHRKKANGKADPGQRPESHPRVGSQQRNKAPDYRKQAIENAATPPGIPPPLVSSVERSLADATKNLQDASPESKAQDVARNQEDSASYFDSETMMKWMKMGYGSSWTLNPKGFSARKEEPPQSATKDDDPTTAQDGGELSPSKPLKEIEPTPELSDTEEELAEPFVQRLEQSIGKFLIGLSGDLENTEFEADAMDTTDEAASDAIRNTQRIYMRTITVQLQNRHRNRSPSAITLRESDLYDKVQVAVYIHQPFIFTFLFDLHTPSLSMPSFYRSIHHQLGPMQKSLLRSTDPERIPERIAEAIGETAEHLGARGIYDLVFDPARLTVRTSMPNIPMPGTLAAEGILGVTRASKTGIEARTISGAWYTLGIPIGPATPAAQYRASDGEKLLKSEWTRVESLNVHTQVLNTYMVTRRGEGGANEIERTVKSSRGWWIVWMRVPVSMSMSEATPSPSPSPARSQGGYFADTPASRRDERNGRGDECEGFLIRKTIETSKGSAATSREKSGKWLLGEGRDISGASTSGNAAATTTARGVVEGVGVDARRWIEGLVKLSS